MNIFKKIEWIWDFYFAHLFYNGMKLHRYDRYMKEKWGSRYTNKK